MKYTYLKTHLKPYVIKSRKSTINHAFAVAVAPFDAFDEAKIRKAIEVLGQNPDEDLRCAYCDRKADTWDHVHPTVKDKKFSCHGHRLGNLLPCCGPCNSSKSGKNWQLFLKTSSASEEIRSLREARIKSYLQQNEYTDIITADISEYRELEKIKEEIFLLMEKADELAKVVREHAVLKKAEEKNPVDGNLKSAGDITNEEIL